MTHELDSDDRSAAGDGGWSTHMEPRTPPGGMTAAELTGTTDAMVWAQQFAIYTRPMGMIAVRDVGFLVGWFANAIEAGRTAGAQSTCLHPFDSLFIADDLVLCQICGRGLKP